MNFCLLNNRAYAAWSLQVWHVVAQSNEFPGYISYTEHSHPLIQKYVKHKVYRGANAFEILIWIFKITSIRNENDLPFSHRVAAHT